MPVYKKNQLVGKFSRQSCTSLQILSHLATFYSLTCFAVFIQPSWLTEPPDSWAPPLVAAFWVIFVVDLALYGFCLCCDTRYMKGLPGMPLDDDAEDKESRICGDCDRAVAQTRVKHCMSCGYCTEGFDHHCRYLNICVGSRNYLPWYIFVFLLLTLVTICSFSNVHAIMEPFRHKLYDDHPTTFFGIVGSAVVVSNLMVVFLFALLAQHSYFCLAGVTTLEFVKAQAPPFPGLPPRGWREAVSGEICPFSWCDGKLEKTDEAADVDEVLYCVICQGDLARAGVQYYQCDSCDATTVCPICFRSSESSETVVTYRASLMRRKSQALLGAMESARNAGSCKSIYSRRSSFSGEHSREVRQPGRRSVGAIVAAVEGHSGERNSFASPCCGRQEQESESESSTEEGG